MVYDEKLVQEYWLKIGPKFGDWQLPPARVNVCAVIGP